MDDVRSGLDCGSTGASRVFRWNELSVVLAKECMASSTLNEMSIELSVRECEMFAWFQGWREAVGRGKVPLCG